MTDSEVMDFVLKETLPNGQVKLVIDNNRRRDTRIQDWVMQMTQLYPGALTEFVSLGELNERRKNVSEELSVSVDQLVDVSTRQKAILQYFELAHSVTASDIHGTIDGELTRIEGRIHGELAVLDELTRDEGYALASTMVLSMCDVTEMQFYPGRVQGARVKADFARKAGVFGARYQHTPTADGLFFVLRIIDDDSHDVPTLEQLGFLPEQQRLAEQILRIPEGMVILSGPTGSGKSTTLRSFSRLYLGRTGGRRRLLTLEDPPEGRIAGAIQIPIIADKSDPASVEQAWNNLSAAALRMDPDAILNGEMRDLNSILAAVYAAETGHLVLTTLHSNSAVGILKRMALLGVSEELIADAQLMTGLISQRLVQVLCPHCRQSWAEVSPQLSPDVKARLERYCDVPGVCHPTQLYFRNPDGCQDCRKSLVVNGREHIVARGIVGRTVIAEVIRPDARFMKLYLAHGGAVARQYWIDSMHGISRLRHLLYKLSAGLVDPVDADLICPLDEDVLLACEVPHV